MSQAPPQMPPPQEPGPRPLDYAQPIASARWKVLALGIAASAFFAFGGGMIAAGLMLGYRGDHDAPEVFATGVGCVIFGVGVVASAWLARR